MPHRGVLQGEQRSGEEAALSREAACDAEMPAGQADARSRDALDSVANRSLVRSDFPVTVQVIEVRRARIRSRPGSATSRQSRQPSGREPLRQPGDA